MTKQKKQSYENIIGWKQDLHTIAKELPHLHKNMFFKRKQEDMEQEMLVLEQQIPFLNDNEIIVGLTRWVASVGDAHTRIGQSPKNVYPLAFYWFKEGIYITHCAPEYNFLLHGYLEGINGHKIKNVIDILRPLIPYENQYQFIEEIPHLLIIPEILHGVNLVSGTGGITYNIRTKEGKSINAFVKPYDKEINIFLGTGPIGLCNSKYIINKKLNYWFEYMETYKTLFFQYNLCDEDPAYSHSELINDLFTMLKKKSVKKLIIDLRYNQGGDSKLLQPFINRLPELKGIKYFDKLYVIIGRATFSSGLLHAINLRRIVGAELIGQPTGGNPNHFGEVMAFRLPYSGLSVCYSTRFFRCSKKDTPYLEPDYIFSVSFNDYSEGKDFIIEFILKQNIFFN